MSVLSVFFFFAAVWYWEPEFNEGRCSQPDSFAQAWRTVISFPCFCAETAKLLSKSFEVLKIFFSKVLADVSEASNHSHAEIAGIQRRLTEAADTAVPRNAMCWSFHQILSTKKLETMLDPCNEVHHSCWLVTDATVWCDSPLNCLVFAQIKHFFFWWIFSRQKL